MAITVYTSNGKVLTNSANDKWLQKKEGPAGFVMNASNTAVTSTNYAAWESPSYPEVYNGNGKTLQVIISEDIVLAGAGSPLLFYYTTVQGPASGPAAVQIPNTDLTAGTRTYTMNNNVAAGGGFGVYLAAAAGASGNPISNWLSKIEFRIID